MDAESLYLAFAKNELENCIRQEMKSEWKRLRPKDGADCFNADAVASLFP